MKISKRLVSKRLVMGSVLTGGIALGVFCLNTTPAVSDMGSKPVVKSTKTYDATLVVAGMGGHFANAVAHIDPNAKQTITLSSLTKIDIGGAKDHPTHDARIDNNDRNTMFWSTYHIDKAVSGTHVGKTDLKTGKVLLDIVVKTDPKATDTDSMYCASAQSKNSFIPYTMTSLAYIDVFNKTDLKQTQRVFLEGTDADTGPYKFYHGASNHKMDRLLVVKNAAETQNGKMSGKMDIVELDMAALEQGKVKVLNKGTVAGNPGSITFRGAYSPDDSMIVMSGADVMFLIDAKTLKAVDVEPVGALEENHDAIFTPDGKYIVATSRTKVLELGCKNPTAPKDGEYLMDGQVKIYDVAAKKFIGQPTSVCGTCHKQEGMDEHAVLCGMDATFK